MHGTPTSEQLAKHKRRIVTHAQSPIMAASVRCRQRMLPTESGRYMPGAKSRVMSDLAGAACTIMLRLARGSAIAGKRACHLLPIASAHRKRITLSCLQRQTTKTEAHIRRERERERGRANLVEGGRSGRKPAREGGNINMPHFRRPWRERQRPPDTSARRDLTQHGDVSDATQKWLRGRATSARQPNE